MRAVFYAVVLFVVFMFTSCGFESNQYKDLKVQVDSIILEHEKLQGSLQEYRNVLIAMNQGVNRMTETQKAQVSLSGIQLDKTDVDLIGNTIDQINKVIQMSKEQVERLRSQLRQSAFRLNQLENELGTMSHEFEQEKEKVAQLQLQLNEKEETIKNLNSKILALETDLSTDSLQIAQQDSVIADQKEILYVAYYIIDTRYELRNANVYSRGHLKKDFDQSLFTKINDIRETTKIRISKFSKGNILTPHPTSSYELVVDTDEVRFLCINDPIKFWEISKYLVIE